MHRGFLSRRARPVDAGVVSDQVLLGVRVSALVRRDEAAGPPVSDLVIVTGHTRSRWVAQRTAAGAPAAKVIRRDDPDRFSFMVIGDTGEGDDPQYAVVPGFLKVSQGTKFAVIASDVIYL